MRTLYGYLVNDKDFGTIVLKLSSNLKELLDSSEEIEKKYKSRFNKKEASKLVFEIWKADFGTNERSFEFTEKINIVDKLNSDNEYPHINSNHSKYGTYIEPFEECLSSLKTDETYVRDNDIELIKQNRDVLLILSDIIANLSDDENPITATYKVVRKFAQYHEIEKINPGNKSNYAYILKRLKDMHLDVVDGVKWDKRTRLFLTNHMLIRYSEVGLRIKLATIHLIRDYIDDVLPGYIHDWMHNWILERMKEG